MSNKPQLNVVVCDPLISTDLSTFSPSRMGGSDKRSGVESVDCPHAEAAHYVDSHVADLRLESREQDPLLDTPRPVKKPFYRARPLWLVPFAITAALVRGMTLAPRVEVFTQLSCSAIHKNYNHTSRLSLAVLEPTVISNSMIISLDPLGPHSLTGSSVHLASREPYHTANVDLNEQPADIPHNPDSDDTDDPLLVPSPHCLSDSDVQAGAARLQTIMTITMGALSALTTGWWGHFGERYGRTKVLATATFGLFITDLMFILVSIPSSPLATHGHKLLFIAPVVEGLLGGWSTVQSATSAYVSDCTSAGSRAQIFSRFTGVFYIGFSVGPSIGGWLIRHSSTNGLFGFLGPSHTSTGRQAVTPVFWVAVMCSLMNFLLVLFVFPESLSKDKQLAARREYDGKRKGKGKAIDLNASDDAPAASCSTSIDEDYNSDRHKGGIIHELFSPLAVFLPATRSYHGTRKRKDWSLTFLAIAMFGYMLSTGVFQIKYLYAVHVYGWSAEQLSYYISFLGGARAIHLLLILPFIIATFKPKPGALRKPKAQSHAFIPNSSKIGHLTGNNIKYVMVPPTKPNPNPSSLGKSKPKPTRAQLAREIQFDLSVTRFSLILDVLSNILVVFSPAPTYKVHTMSAQTPSQQHSQALFVLATSLSSFASGTVPAIQSLALCILQLRAMDAAGNDGSLSDDVPANTGSVSSPAVGKLFGALAVLQAVGQMIIGPMLFGLVYSGSVATYPAAIFVTAGAILLAALGFVLLAQPPTTLPKGKKRRVREEVEVERGRSRVSKDLRRGTGYSGYPSHGIADSSYQQQASFNQANGSIAGNETDATALASRKQDRYDLQADA